MANAIPISLEILVCFLITTALLNRYSDLVKTNIVTIVGVFVSWFFSFMVIFLLPADLTSTAYRQCLFDYQSRTNATTTALPNIETTTTLIPTNASILQLTNSTPYSNIENHLVSEQTPNITRTFSQAYIASNITNPCVIPWNYLTDRTLMKLWRFIYWTCQFLTWLVLPVMQSYSMAGGFTPIDKLKSALKSNFIYYSSFGAIFLILLIYVILVDGLDFANLKVIAISASNTWGLFLLVVLLGYGLVELPRSLINLSQFSQSLDQLYFRVARVNAEKCEAEEKLDDVLEEIQLAFASIDQNENNLMRQYLMTIVDRCPPEWKRRSNAIRRHVATSNQVREPERTVISYDIKSVSRLHRRVKQAVNHHRQTICRWNRLIKEVIEWEDVAKNQAENSRLTTSPVFVATLPKEKTIFSPLYTPAVEWYWKCLVRVWLLRIIGSIMTVLSIAVVWSEMTFPISIFSAKLSVFAYFVDEFQSNQRYFVSEIFSILSIGYLAICAFYTVFHIKVFNVYHLAPRKQTEEYSLLFSGMLVCRLAAPLCLNYLALVHKDSHIIKQDKLLETSFTAIMGHLDLIPVVNNGLNIFLPLCISAICMAIYFNIGTHILHKIGFDQFVQDDEMTLDWVQTGRDLVKREKAKMLRNYDPSSSSNQDVITSSVGTNYMKAGDKKIMTKSSVSPSNIAADLNGSPTSQSSSSSGLSRSSLLPTRNERPVFGDPIHNQQSVSSVQISQTQSDRMSERIIEIDLDNCDVDNNGPSRGLFDDI